ncbi:ABC-type multidrug transport system, ATPase and permease component [Lachnospiraceae bacterium C7]|nr:ABC-type multidrug transport system, ATPase and permease component [Lachnospiraceae bacterium C7]
MLRDNNKMKTITFWIQFYRMVGLFKLQYYFVECFLAIINGLAPIVSLILIKRIVNFIQLKRNIKEVICYLTILVIFNIFYSTCNNVMQYCIEKNEQYFEKNINVYIVEKINNINVQVLESNKFYNILDRVRNDTSECIIESFKTLINIMTLTISSIGYILMLVKLNWILTILVFLFPFIRLHVEKIMNERQYRINLENTENYRRSQYIFSLISDEDKVKEIKCFNLEKYFKEKYSKLQDCVIKKRISIVKKRNILSSIVEISEEIFDAFCLLFLLKAVYSGGILIGSFIAYMNVISNVKQSVTNFMVLYAKIYTYKPEFNMLKKFIQLKEEKKEGVQLNDKIKTIELFNLSFKYPGEEKYIIKNLNYKFEIGNNYVLCGKNGVGKTTLFKIIMGLYNNYKGEILINGVNLKQYNIESYRKHVTFLFQNYIKFEATIRENVSYGSENIDVTDKECNKLLKNNGLEEFEGKLQTVLGNKFENGRQISMGQWQKIAIIRCLLRDSEIMLWDEFNASLDEQSAKEVAQNILDKKDKIHIFIMHKLDQKVIGKSKLLKLENGSLRTV